MFVVRRQTTLLSVEHGLSITTRDRPIQKTPAKTHETIMHRNRLFALCVRVCWRPSMPSELEFQVSAASSGIEQTLFVTRPLTPKCDSMTTNASQFFLYMIHLTCSRNNNYDEIPFKMAQDLAHSLTTNWSVEIFAHTLGFHAVIDKNAFSFSLSVASASILVDLFTHTVSLANSCQCFPFNFGEW